MSRRHAWLTFTTGGMPLPHSLDAVTTEGDGPGSFAVGWQQRLQALQGRWYDVVAPPQVATVFVLQYLLQVPANRIGYAALSLAQLKVMQEVITLAVFVPFAVMYMDQPVKLDYLWAALCLLGAVYFIFRG